MTTESQSPNLSIREKMKKWSQEHAATRKSLIALGAVGLSLVAACGPGNASAEQGPATTIATATSTPGASETATTTETETPTPTETTQSPEVSKVDLTKSNTFNKLPKDQQSVVEKLIDPSYTPEQFEKDTTDEQGALVTRVLAEVYKKQLMDEAGKIVLPGETRDLAHGYSPATGKNFNGATDDWDFAFGTPINKITEDNDTIPHTYVYLNQWYAKTLAMDGTPSQVELVKKMALGTLAQKGDKAGAGHGDAAGLMQEIDQIAKTGEYPNQAAEYPAVWAVKSNLNSLPTWMALELNQPDSNGNLSFRFNGHALDLKDGTNVPSWTVVQSSQDPSAVVTAHSS